MLTFVLAQLGLPSANGVGPARWLTSKIGSTLVCKIAWPGDDRQRTVRASRNANSEPGERAAGIADNDLVRIGLLYRGLRDSLRVAQEPGGMESIVGPSDATTDPWWAQFKVICHRAATHAARITRHWPIIPRLVQAPEAGILQRLGVENDSVQLVELASHRAGDEGRTGCGTAGVSDKRPRVPDGSITQRSHRSGD